MTDSNMSLSPDPESERFLPQGIKKRGYRILRSLGRGGFGRVFLAEDSNDNDCLVAIKVLNLDSFDRNEREQVIGWFNREAKTLSELKHDHIAQIHSVYYKDHFFVMDYVPGKNLDDVLEEAGGQIAWPQVIQWGLVLCDVLTYLHQQSPPFVFRDMKLSNVILDSTTNSPTVVDFGLAKQLTAPGSTIIGTLGYMPYEQWDGEAEPRSDIHALGASMHALLTGCHPPNTFHRLRTVLGSAERAMRNLFDPVDSLVPDVPTSLAQVIAKATAFDPEDRYSTAESMAEALREVMRQHPDGLNLVVAADGSGHYTSINQAIEHARVGARIEVKPGIYDEEVIIDREVELIAIGQVNEVILQSTSGSCLVMQANHATVQGMTLRCRAGRSLGESAAVEVPLGQLEVIHCMITSDSMACVLSYGHEASPIIRDCWIHDGPVGIWFFDGGGGIVEQCHIVNCQGEGIIIAGGSDPFVRNCTIRDGENDGVYIHSGGRGTIEGCSIIRNEIAGVRITNGGDPVIRRCNVRKGHYCGLWIYDDGRGLIDSCDVSGNARLGVVVTRGGKPVIRECSIHDNEQAGVLVYRERSRGAAILTQERIFKGVSEVDIREPSSLQVHRSLGRDESEVGTEIGGDTVATMENCDIFGDQRSGILIVSSKASVVSNCGIHDGRGVGVRVIDSQATIENCQIWNNEDAGISAKQDNATIRGCNVHEGKAWGIYLEESNTQMNDCEIWGHTRSEIFITSERYGREGESDPVVRRCRIRNGLRGGIHVERSNATIEECEIYGHELSGITITQIMSTEINWGGDEDDEPGPVVHNCRIYDCGQAGIYAYKFGKGKIKDCTIFGNELAGVKITGLSAIYLRSCTICDGKAEGVVVDSEGYGSISSCNIIGNALDGIRIEEGGNPKVWFCEIRSNQQCGIFIAQGGRGNVYKSQIVRNTVDGVTITKQGNPKIEQCAIIDSEACGVRVVDGGCGVIEDCQIHGNALAGIDIGGYGNPLISRCTVRDGASQGIWVHDSGYGMIEDCDILANRKVGVEVAQSGNPLVRKCRISRNAGVAIQVHSSGTGIVENCYLASAKGAWDIDSSCWIHRKDNIELACSIASYALARLSQSKSRDLDAADEDEEVHAVDGEVLLVADQAVLSAEPGYDDQATQLASTLDLDNAVLYIDGSYVQNNGSDWIAISDEYAQEVNVSDFSIAPIDRG